MKQFVGLTLIVLVAVPCFAQWQHPPTRTVDVTDTYFGKTYRDPYRWLEDLKDKEVDAWFKAQAELTDSLLAKIPAKAVLAHEWVELAKLTPASYSSIAYKSGRVFYRKILEGRENVDRLFFREGWNGAEKLLFDPSTYKPGVATTIASQVPSFDGRYVALGLSANGADFSEIRILDVDRGTLLSESFYPSFGPYEWSLDSKSLFYDAGKVTDIESPEIQLNRKTRLHKLGTDFSSDRDFFSNESNPELGITPKEIPGVVIDESYPDYIFGLVFTAQQELRIFYAPTSEMNSQRIRWKVLCTPSDNLVRDMVFYKAHVYAITHANAPHYKVVRTSVKHPDWAHAETVLPEAKDSVQSLTQSEDFLFVRYSNGIVDRIVKYDFARNRASELTLPGSGTAEVRCPDWHTNRCIVYLTSWTRPTTLYDFDGDKDAFSESIFNTDVTYPGFDSLVTEEVEVPGHDGALVPLSIIHRKGIPLDGSNSCILEGYGAFGFSDTPSFDVTRSIALRDVVLAYAHPRGGGEKGEAWYKAGYKTTKPNTWKDFISCAEYLVRQGYTSPEHLAGIGTSAGGILISRAITSRPDLFGAAVCNVGDANAMRMEFSPNGPVNTPEFGSVKDRVECEALYEMDGVQHVQPGVKYPAVLCVAGWNDQRVAPWQPGKFAAALQNASASGRPVLLKVNYESGHFTEEAAVATEDFVSQLAFLLWQTGHKDFQPANRFPNAPGQTEQQKSPPSELVPITPGARLTCDEKSRENRKGAGEVVTYSVRAAGLPTGKWYSLTVRTMDGTTWEGKNVVIEPSGPVLGENGMDAEVKMFTTFPGDFFVVSLVSEDGSSSASVEVTPLPIHAEGAGGCRLLVRPMSPQGDRFQITGDGFVPDRDLRVTTTSSGERTEQTVKGKGDGALSLVISPAAAGKTGGDATLAASDSTCSVTVSYKWGDQMRGGDAATAKAGPAAATPTPSSATPAADLAVLWRRFKLAGQALTLDYDMALIEPLLGHGKTAIHIEGLTVTHANAAEALERMRRERQALDVEIDKEGFPAVSGDYLFEEAVQEGCKPKELPPIVSGPVTITQDGHQVGLKGKTLNGCGVIVGNTAFFKPGNCPIVSMSRLVALLVQFEPNQPIRVSTYDPDAVAHCDIGTLRNAGPTREWEKEIDAGAGAITIRRPQKHETDTKARRPAELPTSVPQGQTTLFIACSMAATVWFDGKQLEACDPDHEVPVSSTPGKHTIRAESVGKPKTSWVEIVDLPADAFTTLSLEKGGKAGTKVQKR